MLKLHGKLMNIWNRCSDAPFSNTLQARTSPSQLPLPGKQDLPDRLPPIHLTQHIYPTSATPLPNPHPSNNTNTQASKTLPVSPPRKSSTTSSACATTRSCSPSPTRRLKIADCNGLLFFHACKLGVFFLRSTRCTSPPSSTTVRSLSRPTARA